MIILALFIVVLVAAGSFAFVVFGGVLKIESDQNKAERNAESILDSTFDGCAKVTFTPHMRTLKYETVIAGAEARDYRLTHQTGNQYGPLMFEKNT